MQSHTWGKARSAFHVPKDRGNKIDLKAQQDKTSKQAKKQTSRETSKVKRAEFTAKPPGLCAIQGKTSKLCTRRFTRDCVCVIQPPHLGSAVT